MSNKTKCCIEQTITDLCKRITRSPETVKTNEKRAHTVLLLTKALYANEKAASCSAVDGYTEGLKG